MIRRPPRSTLSSSSAASDVYKRQFLIGKGDVDTRKAEPSHALEHPLQLLASGARDFDEVVVAAQAQRLGGALVHGRRGRVRDRRTEQTGEEAALGHGTTCHFVSAAPETPTEPVSYTHLTLPTKR